MSFPWPYLLLLIPAVPLAWADFRRREVSVVWLAVLGAGCFGVAWRMQGLETTLLDTGLNTALLVLFGLILTGWHLLRGKPLRTIFRSSFGSGDAVMMLATTPLFAPTGYVRFLLAGCVAALVWWFVKRPATLPLAGFMALTLAGYAVFKTTGLWS